MNRQLVIDNPKAVSVKRAAELICRSVSYVRNEIRAKKLKAKKAGRGVIITADALEDYITNLPDWQPEEK